MRYFAIIEPDQFNTEINEAITEALGYEKTMLFGEVVQCAKELNNGNWGISANICPADLLSMGDVKGIITEQQYEIMGSLFGELMTIEEFRKLDFKIEEILINTNI